MTPQDAMRALRRRPRHPSHNLVLAVLCIQADAKGLTHAPAAALGEVCNLSRDEVREALVSLIQRGEIGFVIGAKGWFSVNTTPTQTPAAEIATRASPAPDLTSDDVARVVRAARLECDPERPLYWRQSGHIADLRDVLARTGYSLDDLCSHLSDLELPPKTRRFTALLPFVRKKV